MSVKRTILENSVEITVSGKDIPAGILADEELHKMEHEFGRLINKFKEIDEYGIRVHVKRTEPELLIFGDENTSPEEIGYINSTSTIEDIIRKCDEFKKVLNNILKNGIIINGKRRGD